MCNRYTPSSHEDPHFKTWLALNPTNYPPEPWRKLGPWGTGPYFQPTGEGVTVGLSVGQWGMIRPGAPERREKAGKSWRMTNNCRSETMAKLATFKQAWASGRRCIIPAVSFDEPNWESGKNVWWEFRRADGHPWGIAGLFSEWTNPQTGEVVPNYTMVTCNADHHPLMSRMHRPEFDKAGELLVPQDKRSIVPLDPADWNTWLFGSTDEAAALIKLPPVEVYDAGPEEKKRLTTESPPSEGLF